MTTIQEQRLEQFIDLWKKYYSDKASVCLDCGGMSWQVCEKAMRDMFGAYLNRMDKHIKESENKFFNLGLQSAIDALPPSDQYERDEYDRTSVTQYIDGYNTYREEAITNIQNKKI